MKKFFKILINFKFWHPFLFGLFPVIFSYIQNIEELPLNFIILPLWLVLGSVIIFWLFLVLVFKNKEKVSLGLSFFILWFFSYGHLTNLLWAFSINDFVLRHRHLLVFWVILFIVVIYLIIKTSRRLTNFTKFLNITASILVIISLAQLGFYQIRKRAIFNNFESVPVMPISTEISSENLPDIYYIILDSYGSFQVLNEFYDFDNGEFLEELKKRGFWVANNSKSNYTQSNLSIASSLNLEYLDFLRDQLGENSQKITPLTQLIEENFVVAFLKSRGYQYIKMSSGYVQYKTKNREKIYFIGQSNEFLIFLAKTTILRPFIDQLFEGPAVRRGVLACFDRLSQVPQIKEPTFVYAHIISPHPPFVFGPNGEPKTPLNMIGETITHTKQRYIDQLIFINKKTLKLIDLIIAQSKNPPIIIVQADHGPSYQGPEGWTEQPEPDLIRQRMGILNAYYLPQIKKADLYDSISPVNTFRYVFDHYFGTNLGLLEDEHFFSNYNRPYKFINVTEILKE